MVVLPSSSSDLQLALQQFVAECEVAEMRINTSKSKIMVLKQKRVESPLRVWEELLPQVEEYLGFCSQLREYWRLTLGNQIGVASTVMQTLY